MKRPVQDSKQMTDPGKRRKKDMGRNEWRRQSKGKQGRNNGERRDRRGYPSKPTDADAPDSSLTHEGEPAEMRRPKRKVAVMIGYSGTGYQGMQVNNTAKTIEGDLFKAFVAAGAISKANSNDPKKSSLVRCARTDKGVHAAGNIISLKLIIEDPDVVQKINEHLPSQIRVWGIERTNGGFSAYQLCDSRIYEYLVPSHVMLPPHPQSFLGQRLEELAQKAGDVEGLRQRQSDAAGFWDEADEKFVKPVLEAIPDSIRQAALVAVHRAASGSQSEKSAGVDPVDAQSDPDDGGRQQHLEKVKSLETAVRQLKAAYVRARNSYRIPRGRLERLRQALDGYCGTHRFHNYTIGKSYREDSAKRVIKTFRADEPIVIGDTEWLSLKVHGQSFMMHQIRKMVSLAALVVRTGCPLERIEETYGPTRFTIPKAPGLGLLLERPVFDNYNERAAHIERNAIDFDNYRDAIDDFKRKMIYEHIFAEEEREKHFHSFFAQIDSIISTQFLYLSSKGLEALPTGPENSAEKDDVDVLTVIEGKDKEDGDGSGEGDDGSDLDADQEDGQGEKKEVATG